MELLGNTSVNVNREIILLPFLTGVLETYNALKSADDPPLSEIFLHSRSSISDEEYSRERAKAEQVLRDLVRG